MTQVGADWRGTIGGHIPRMIDDVLGCLEEGCPVSVSVHSYVEHLAVKQQMETRAVGLRELGVPTADVWRRVYILRSY